MLTDAVRGAAAGLPAGIVVISRENLLALLPPGTDPTACLGDCEVETGRLLGARYVVAGRVARLGKSLVLTLTLHATADGALLRSEQAEAPTPTALADAARGAAARLLGGLRTGATAPDATDAEMLAILARPPAEQVGAFADLGDARAAEDAADADRAYRAAARALEGLNARTRLQDAVRGAAARARFGRGELARSALQGTRPDSAAARAVAATHLAEARAHYTAALKHGDKGWSGAALFRLADVAHTYADALAHQGLPAAIAADRPAILAEIGALRREAVQHLRQTLRFARREGVDSPWTRRAEALLAQIEGR